MIIIIDHMYIRACRLRMLPSLDIYSFGMVVLYLFTERNWWDNALPRSPDITERNQQVSSLVADVEGVAVLEGIGQQLRAMLDPNPRCRPQEVTECFFDLN